MKTPTIIATSHEAESESGPRASFIIGLSWSDFVAVDKLRYGNEDQSQKA